MEIGHIKLMLIHYIFLKGENQKTKLNSYFVKQQTIKYNQNKDLNP